MRFYGNIKLWWPCWLLPQLSKAVDNSLAIAAVAIEAAEDWRGITKIMKNGYLEEKIKKGHSSKDVYDTACHGKIFTCMSKGILYLKILYCEHGVESFIHFLIWSAFSCQLYI